MRDDFPKEVKRAIAGRAGYRCSNPNCQAWTAGPCLDSDKAASVGVAAHISAASPGGPRYNAALTAEERRATSNGIWLCQNCAKHIDDDPERYTEELLRSWKNQAASLAAERIGRTASLDIVDSRFVDTSPCERFGDTGFAMLEEGGALPFARIVAESRNSLTYYIDGAYVTRFMVAKRPRRDYVLISQIRARVLSYSSLPIFRPVFRVEPYETKLYFVELAQPSGAAPRICLAERYFAANREVMSEAARFSPLLLEDDIPETIDVLVSAKEAGIYTFSLEAVAAQVDESRVIEVLPPTTVLFDSFEN